MNVFHEAAETLSESLKCVAGETVQYQTGTTVLTLTASLGKSVLTVESTEGFIIQAISIDFLIDASDLVDGLGNRITPAKGDTVTRCIEGPTPLVYELMSPPYSPSDPAGRRLRLHAKLISQDA